MRETLASISNSPLFTDVTIQANFFSKLALKGNNATGAAGVQQPATVETLISNCLDKGRDLIKSKCFKEAGEAFEECLTATRLCKVYHLHNTSSSTTNGNGTAIINAADTNTAGVDDKTVSDPTEAVSHAPDLSPDAFHQLEIIEIKALANCAQVSNNTQP